MSRWRNRNRDDAPIGHTCPKIDQVIAFLDKIEWDVDNEDEENLRFSKSI